MFVMTHLLHRLGRVADDLGVVEFDTLHVLGPVGRVALLGRHLDGAARDERAHAIKHARLQRALLREVGRDKLQHAARRRRQRALNRELFLYCSVTLSEKGRFVDGRAAPCLWQQYTHTHTHCPSPLHHPSRYTAQPTNSIQLPSSRNANSHWLSHQQLARLGDVAHERAHAAAAREQQLHDALADAAGRARDHHDAGVVAAGGRRRAADERLNGDSLMSLEGKAWRGQVGRQ